MPDIALAPAPATSTAAPANAAANAAGKAAGTAAGDDTGSSLPFGQLLKKIVAQAGKDQILPVLIAAKVGAGETAATDAAVGEAPPLDAAGLAALLADMPGLAAAAATEVAKEEDPVDDAVAAALAATGQAGNETGLPLAAPATPPTAPATAEMPVIDAEAPAAAVTANTANTAAIVAAAQAESGNAMQGNAAAEDLLAAVPTASREAAGNAAAHLLQQPAAATAPVPTARIETPVGAPQWNGEFADRLAWMVGRNESRAELVLNPPQLGRIEVSLAVNGDQANALFVAANPSAREAIENALPRLREVLADAGIQLGQAQVGSESPQQSPNGKENKDNQPQGLALGHDGKPMPAGFAVNSPTAWLSSGRGMIDVFA